MRCSPGWRCSRRCAGPGSGFSTRQHSRKPQPNSARRQRAPATTAAAGTATETEAKTAAAAAATCWRVCWAASRRRARSLRRPASMAWCARRSQAMCGPTSRRSRQRWSLRSTPPSANRCAPCCKPPSCAPWRRTGVRSGGWWTGCRWTKPCNSTSSTRAAKNCWPTWYLPKASRRAPACTVGCSKAAARAPRVGISVLRCSTSAPPLPTSGCWRPWACWPRRQAALCSLPAIRRWRWPNRLIWPGGRPCGAARRRLGWGW